MTKVDRLADEAIALGWKAEHRKASAPISEAFGFRHHALPGVEIVAMSWAQRHGFQARLLVCGVERGIFDHWRDALAVMADHDLIQPRCKGAECSRPSKAPDRFCPFHEAGPDPDNEARYARGERGSF